MASKSLARRGQRPFSEGTLDHPSVRDEHETGGLVRALDDFDDPAALSGKGLLESPTLRI